MIEEELRNNRGRILTGRVVFLLYVVVYSCAVFIPLALVFVRAAGAPGWVAVSISLALWATLLALVIYYNADIVRKATGAVPLEEGQYHRLASAAEDIAIVSGQEAPRLMLIDDKAANAFAMVSTRKRNSVVFCTEKLARDLDRDEMRAVMAHEMAHLMNGDADICSLILPFAALAPSLYRPVLRLVNFSARPAKVMICVALGLFLVPPVIVLILPVAWPVITSEAFAITVFGLLMPFISLYILGTLVSVYWSFTLRKREYLADETAVIWTNYPEGMIEALLKTGKNNTRSNLAFLDDACFAPPGGYRGLLDFQPSLIDRIDNIRKETYLPPA